MRISSDSWLTTVLGFAVFRVDDAVSQTPDDVGLLDAHVARQTRALYYTKVDVCAVGVVEAMTRQGFSVVDVNMMLAARPANVVAEAPRDEAVDVAFAADDQRSAVLDIAGSCFRYTRFHLDPHLTLAQAHSVKREWIVSYFDRQRGDRLFVARRSGSPAGFLAAAVTAHDGVQAAAIDLVGVAIEQQRSGVGRALVRQFAAHYSGCAQIIVGTQAANVPSLRMYEGLGFRAARSTYVLHRHVGVSQS